MSSLTLSQRYREIDRARVAGIHRAAAHGKGGAMKIWRLVASVLFVGFCSFEANAKTIPVNVKIDAFAMTAWNCVGTTFCWGTNGFDITFSPVTVDLGDLLRVRLDFEGPYLLRWEDDGFIPPAPWALGDESVSLFVTDSTQLLTYQGKSTAGLSFLGVRGDLLVNNLSWDFDGASGGLPIATYLSPFPADHNFTNSAFAFSGIEADFQAHTCNIFCPPYTVDRFIFSFATGNFSIIRVPEPPTLALLSLAFAGIGLARRRNLH